MAIYDDIDRENGEAPTTPETNITEPATETPAEEVAAEQPSAEEPAAPATEAPASDDRPAVSYTPDDHYNPYGSSYGTAPRTSMGYETKTEEKRSSRARVAVLSSILVLALLFVSFFGGAAFGRFGLGSLPGNEGGDGTPTIPSRGDVVLNVIERDPAEYGKYDIPTIVQNVQDTVVEIRTETTVTSAYYGDYIQSGAGSGVILSSDGLILTCDHVIAGAGTITVVLTNGDQYTAEIYGEDSWSDLALLKIQAQDLSYASLPATATEEGITYKDYLAVGEGVIAIGNPLGELGGSVSNGIISALGRQVTVEGVPMTLLQTNAAVNPGNSGGGLFNMYGELIGIVNAKSTGDSVEGIGFAIPISDAVGVYRQLYSQGYVSGRPFLGLYFEESSSGLQILSYDYNDELTGGQTIQNGDMLYSADGTVINSMSDLRTVIAGKEIGDTMTIQVERYERRGYTYVRIPLEFTIKIHEYVPAS